MQCRRCLYTSDHPLNITFDEDEICSGCRVHEEKDTIVWEERWLKLKKIVESYKSRSGLNYDCIVPVSGARDSHFVVHLVKNELGLNPLLVSYNKHFNTDIGARNLANLRIKFDCDITTQTIQPDTIKRITRETLRRFGSVYWHCIAGETVFPVQMAVRLKIPLIIWGAHQGIDQVGMFSHLNEVEMTRKYRKEHDLMGFEAEDLYGEMENLQEEHLKPFHYPDDYHIQRVGVRGIYLNNYIRWDSRAQHEKMIKLYDYETSNMGRSFDYYNDVDSFIYLHLHDHLKNLKHGYTKVVDHACREIRLKRLKKETAFELVDKYSAASVKYMDLFAKWLNVDQTALQFVLDEHRNPQIWERDNDWNWIRKSKRVSELKSDPEFDEMCLSAHREFQLTAAYKSSDKHGEYILHPHGNRI